MGTDLYTFATKSESTIRDDFLRTLKSGLQLQAGIAEPNVLPGSDYFLIGQALGNEIAPIYANTSILADQLMPDTSTDVYLDRNANAIQLTRRSVSGSTGNIILESSQPSLVATGAQLLDAAGLRYEVSTGGTYVNGATIPIDAIDGGKASNHAAGDSLRWQSAPPYSAQSALVGYGGLTNGYDDEDDETLRARVFARFANPPGSGDAQHVAELAEAAHPSVQKAYVYPAAQGPATVHAAVTGYTSTTSKTRNLDATITSTTVAGYVIGKLPEHAGVTLTTVANVNTDVSFELTIPSAPSASPPGRGGGWIDGTPWPRNSAASATFKCAVTVVSSSTIFTVDAPTSPIAGASHIAWLSTLTWTVYKALVTAVTGTAGAYTIAIDVPFTGIAAGDYIWPQAVNQQAYADAVILGFALMGPGEKTANSTILQRAYRHPVPTIAWPYSLDASMTKRITDVGDEITSATFLYRSTTTPAVPGAITDPPNILVPRRIAFYQAA